MKGLEEISIHEWVTELLKGRLGGQVRPERCLMKPAESVTIGIEPIFLAGGEVCRVRDFFPIRHEVTFESP